MAAKYKQDQTVYEFDPIKDLKGNEQAQQVIWTTKALNIAVDAIKKGLPLKVNPFIGNNTKLLKPELVFNRTEEEVEDYVKCMNDVIYFASKCYIMGPEGLHPCKLRDYQIDYLNHLQNNRFSIFLACRQAGKTLNFQANVKLKIVKNKKINKNIVNKLEKLNYFYIKEEDIYYVPLYEVYNLCCKQTLLWKIKYHLYKIIFNLEKNGRKERTKG